MKKLLNSLITLYVLSCLGYGFLTLKLANDVSWDTMKRAYKYRTVPTSVPAVPAEGTSERDYSLVEIENVS